MPVDRVKVVVYPPGEIAPVPAGTLTLQPRMSGCTFRYDDTYLARENAFAIDPFALPLVARDFAFPKHGDGVLPPAFADAGPDAWGRKFMDQTLKLDRSSDFDYFVASAGQRVGAIALESDGARLPEDTASLTDIEVAIDRVRQKLPIEARLQRILMPGSGLGGVRPKTTITHDNALWIAKFNARDEDVDAVSLEYATMKLARHCGIHTAETERVELGENRRALLVKRFDRYATPAGFCRVHYLCARTLIEGYASQSGERPDESYLMLAEARRTASPAGTITNDLQELFRRIVFNIIVDNTDDHWKNHGFLLMKSGWQLSPAFDLSTQMTNLGYQSMVVGEAETESSLANALSACALFGLRKESAEAIINDVSKKALVWREIYAGCGVDQALLDRMEPGFKKRSELSALAIKPAAAVSGRRSPA